MLTGTFLPESWIKTTRQAPCVGSTWQQPEIKVAAIHSCLSAWFQAQMAHKQVLVVVSAQQLAWLILGRADHCNIVTRVEGHLWLIGETWFIYDYWTCSSPRVIQAKQSQQDSTETKKIMVRTNIGVKWMDIPTNPLTGTIAYEVHTKRFIPGPANYDREYMHLVDYSLFARVHICRYALTRMLLYMPANIWSWPTMKT